MKLSQFFRRALGLVVCTLALGSAAWASEAGAKWDKAPDRSHDMAALQNGAKLFVNYCVNCHSAAFMRYTRLTDLGLTPDQIKQNLLLTDNKYGETMKASIDAKQAKEWFGNTPPDLTVIARSRAGAGGSGADYLYTYMRTFYRDDNKATGWNNHTFPNVAMPHVLWELQQTLSPSQYDAAVADLVGYMQWMAEPAQNTRKSLGVWVLAFLGLMVVITWRLNKAYWKDVK
ncbi:MAG: cytochrome c1 [Rhodoferax sp.]